LGVLPAEKKGGEKKKDREEGSYEVKGQEKGKVVVQSKKKPRKRSEGAEGGQRLGVTRKSKKICVCQ